MAKSDVRQQMVDDAANAAGGAPTKDALAEIVEEVVELERHYKMRDTAKEHLKSLNEEIERIERVKIPDKMLESDVAEVRMNDGRRLTVVDQVHAKIADKNREAAFAWLRANDLGDGIKAGVTVDLVPDDEGESAEERSNVLTLLKKAGLSFTEKETIHPSTLKALIKELTEQGVEIDEKLFGVFRYRQAKISKK